MSDPYQIFETGADDKPVAYVLVGLPGSGKSVWARGHPQKLPIVSTDAYIEKYAAEHEVDYAQAFKRCYVEARNDMKAQVVALIKNPVDFIWDQVNLEPEMRSSIHERLEPTHRVVYVVFRVPLAECLHRHKVREREGGALVDEARIRMLAKDTVFPQKGKEPFHSLIVLTHPGWNM